MKLKIDRLRFRGAIAEFGQTRLAEKLGCTQSNISRMLHRDLETLTIRRFNRVCEAMEIDPRVLIVFEEEELAEIKKAA